MSQEYNSILLTQTELTENRLPLLIDVVNRLFDSLQPNYKEMKKYVNDFIEELNDTNHRRSQFNITQLNLYDGLVEQIRREMCSLLRYNFENNLHDIGKFFRDLLVKYKIEYLLLDYNSQFQGDYLLSVIIDKNTKLCDDEMYDEDNPDGKFMVKDLDILISDECYKYFNICLSDSKFAGLGCWMDIKFLGSIKITPLTFDSTEL